MLKRIPCGFYFLALMMFFWPWWTAAGLDKPLPAVTGVQTVTGFNYSDLHIDVKQLDAVNVPPNALVIAAAVLVFGAFAAGLEYSPKLYAGSGIMAMLAPLLLLYAKSKGNAALTAASDGALKLHFEPAFWAVMFALAAGAVIQFCFITGWMEEKPVEPADAVPVNQPEQKQLKVGKSKRYYDADVAAVETSEPAAVAHTDAPPSKKYRDEDFMPPGMRSAPEQPSSAPTVKKKKYSNEDFMPPELRTENRTGHDS